MEQLRWKKSPYSQGQGSSDCVEVAHTLTRLRDSKNPGGRTLKVPVGVFVEWVKARQD